MTRALVTLAAVFALASPAAASLVNVTGRITHFSGTVGYDNQFYTYFDTGSGPTLICPDAGCLPGISIANVNLNTPSVEFWSSLAGTDNTHNELAFASAAAEDVGLGQEFLWGSITYTNGIWFTDPVFDVEFTSHSADPAFDGHVFTDTVHLFITTNNAALTPAQNADFVYFVGHPELGSIRAYELGNSPTGSNSVTVEFYGHINSLDPDRFANPTGGGFLSPSIEPLPEPAGLESLALLLLAGLAAARRRD